MPGREELHRRLLAAALDRADETVADVLQGAAGAGWSHRDVLIGLVAGVATDLGDRWHQDEVGFLDVTLGTGKLQRAIHDFGLSPHRPSERKGQVLVTTVPGEQHSLGAAIGSRLLALEGFETSLDLLGSDAVDGACAAGYHMVLVAVPSSRSLMGLDALVRRMRSGCRKPECSIMLTGSGASPEIAEGVGADGWLESIDDVLDLLERGRGHPA